MQASKLTQQPRQERYPFIKQLLTVLTMPNMQRIFLVWNNSAIFTPASWIPPRMFLSSAWQHWKVNERKFAFDQYERRLRVYQEVISFLTRVLRDFKIDIGDLTKNSITGERYAIHPMRSWGWSERREEASIGRAHDGSDPQGDWFGLRPYQRRFAGAPFL